jgi:hypothetical protein
MYNNEIIRDLLQLELCISKWKWLVSIGLKLVQCESPLTPSNKIISPFVSVFKNMTTCVIKIS